MASSTLPYMKTNPKIIFFTDFDGTITLEDSNDFLVRMRRPHSPCAWLTDPDRQPGLWV